MIIGNAKTGYITIAETKNERKLFYTKDMVTESRIGMGIALSHSLNKTTKLLNRLTPHDPHKRNDEKHKQTCAKNRGKRKRRRK